MTYLRTEERATAALDLMEMPAPFPLNVHLHLHLLKTSSCSCNITGCNRGYTERKSCFGATVGIVTHRSLIRVCKSQTFHKYDEDFKDKLLHQGVLLPEQRQ